MSKGFSYYNTDTDRYQDMRIKRLKKKQGCEGIAVYDYLLCEIYRVEGYYVNWNEDTIFDVSEYFDIAESRVVEIVNFCCEIGLFDAQLCEEKKALTSTSIQARYKKKSAKMKRYDANIRDELSLFREETEEIREKSEKFANVREETEEIREKSEYIRKKSKVKESKVKESISLSVSLSDESDTSSEEREREDIFMIFFFKNFINPKNEVDRFWAHYQATGWERGARAITDKVALATAWEEESALRANPRPFPKPFIDLWRLFYSKVRVDNKSAAHALIAELRGVEYQEGVLSLTCGADTKDAVEMYAETLRGLLPSPIQIKYRVARSAMSKNS